MAQPGALTLPDTTLPSAAPTDKCCLGLQDFTLAYVNDDGVTNLLRARFNPNILRNADLRFAQRQVPGTLTTYSATAGRSITADGWGVTNENASIQYIRTATSSAPESNLKAATYGTWSKITSTGKIILSQVIENTDAMPLRSTLCRFQVKMKASAAKTIKIAVVQLNSAGTANTMPATFISAFGANNVDPTLGTNLAYIAPQSGITGDNCTLDTNSFICNVTTSWQRFGGVFLMPSDLKNIIVLIWTDVQFAAADTLSVSECSFGPGQEIQDFDTQPYQSEMNRVQRFFSKSFSIDQNPTTAVGVNTGEKRGVAGKTTTGTDFIAIEYPVEMRSAPTVTTYSPASANATARDITAGADSGAVTVTGNTVKNCYLSFAGNAGSAVGNLFGCHYSADAEI
jgi:hypothetical protein